MDFHITGDYKHYGDNIEKGGKKIVYNGDKSNTKTLSEEELKYQFNVYFQDRSAISWSILQTVRATAKGPPLR